MELIKRYIYAVTHKLPEKQRADIEQELHGLIEDMLDHRTGGGEITQRDVEEVLVELGPPQELAAKYKGNNKYLISPELFDIYWIVVRIVVVSIAVALGIGMLIEFMLEPIGGGQFIGEFVGSLISVSVQGFAWVTIVFALLEYSGVKASQIGFHKKKEWMPSQLTPIPNPKTRIKRSDPIAAIIATVLFTILFISSIHYFGIIHFNDNGSSVVIPFLNEAVFRDYYPLLWGMIALSVFKDCMKLVIGSWTKELAFLHLFFNIASLVIAIIVFMNPAIWNSEFMNELAASGMVSAGSEGFQTAGSIWSNATDKLIYIIVAITIIDSLWVVWKMYRFGLRR